MSAAAHRRRWWLRRSALADVTAVLRGAVTVLFGHWPVLCALAFAGLGARHYLISVAVQASKLNSVLGFMVLVLVPITMMTALIFMLLAVRASLPWLVAAASTGPAPPAGETGDDDGEPAPRRAGLVDHLGSVLVPFLAVYASYGYLGDDRVAYLNALLEDAPFGGDENAFLRRLPFEVGFTLWAVVVGALLVRWLMGRGKVVKRRPWLGIVAAYVEVVWISLSAVALYRIVTDARAWLESRRVVHGLMAAGNAVVDRLGPLASPAHSGLDLIGTLVGSVDDVIVVPVAWLAVGAVVYGHRIRPPAPSSHDVLDLAARRWLRLPAPLRRIGAQFGGDFRERFGPLWFGLRLLLRAGLRPMLLFCLVFLLVQKTGVWLFQLERWIVGPHDLGSVWLPLSVPLSVFNNGVRTVLLVALLGAAVDRVLRAEDSLTA